ncbi:MAG TPA: histidine kinase [Streptosporangiaceae bacterium]|nr:histidine kinase [Streptosporangiaceae bacterium]
MLAKVPRSLTARLAALPPRRQELAQDLGLGVALATVNVVSLLPYRDQLHPSWLALLLVAAQGLPLAWRRYWPIGVALVIGGARVAYDQIGFGFAPFPLGPAIALYTVMDRRSAGWRWVSMLVVAAAIGISQAAPGHHQPYDTIFQVMIFAAATAAGLLSRAMRASVQAAQSRADRAEAELDRQSSQAAERERIRIARELHDVVAHHVSLIAVQAEAAASLLPGRPDQARRSVEVIGDTARQALTELRRLLGVLRRPSARPETAPSASLGDLGEVLDQVRGAGLPVDFEVTGTPVPLAPGVDLTAYRIVQEALTNTIRHANAARAAVRLCYEPGYITVSVTDFGRPSPAAGNGSGTVASGAPGVLAAAPLLTGSGLGLAGIAERVASCGGNLTVGPTPEVPGAEADGFAVTARLPSR